jgi:hypothetical protein
MLRAAQRVRTDAGNLSACTLRLALVTQYTSWLIAMRERRRRCVGGCRGQTAGLHATGTATDEDDEAPVLIPASERCRKRRLGSAADLLRLDLEARQRTGLGF